MTTKLPVLLSYAYLREEKTDVVERIFSEPDIEFLIDSGAFTVANTGGEPIDVDEYMGWIRRYESRLFGYIALDRLGDPATTERNLKTMLDGGLKPIPVHVLGDDEDRMNKLFQYSEWVALGGFRRPGRGHASPAYVKTKMKWANGRKVHWLGYTRAQSIATWSPFSVDCSNFLAGAVHGSYLLYLGRSKWITISPMTKKTRNKRLASPESISLNREAVQRLESWGYESTGEMLWKGGEWSSLSSACSIPIHSYIEWSLDVRERYGTRFFLACRPQHTEAIFSFFKKIREKRESR